VAGEVVKKGPLAEAQVVACLQEHGFTGAERRVMGGRNDRGDIAGIPGVVIEVKNCAEMKLAAWVDEARVEASQLLVAPFSRRRFDFDDEHSDLALVWHKRRGKGDPLDWYVTMTGRDFLVLLAEYTREA